VKYVIHILNWIKSNKVLAFLLIGLLTGCSILFLREQGRAKCEDCMPFKKQNEQLIGALIDIRKELTGTISAASYKDNGAEIFVMFAADTVPKKVRNQQQQVQKVIKKLDSIILKYRISQQQKQKT